MESTLISDGPHLLAAIRRAWAALRAAPEFAEFDRSLQQLDAPTLLFGGFPRLIERGGDPMHARDIDIVVDTDRWTLEATVKPWVARNTRFGGMNLRVGSQRVDIWALRDTWAFRADKVTFARTPENLIRTVFLSVDALAIDIRGGEVFADIYRSSIQRMELDIVLRENPYPALCVLRSLVFAYEYGMRPSRRLRRYIQDYLRRNSAFEDLMRMQVAHYGCERVTPDALKSWLLSFRGKQAQLWLFDAPALPNGRVRQGSREPDDPYVSCLLGEQDPEQRTLFNDAHPAAAAR